MEQEQKRVQVQLDWLDRAVLNEQEITSDKLKVLDFPDITDSIFLSNNQITTLKGVEFPTLRLDELDLSHNQITSLEGVKFPDTLRTLNLSHNQITTLEGVTFPVRLRTLDLSNNPKLKLTGVGDLIAYMGEWDLRNTDVTLEGDLCFIIIPDGLVIKTTTGDYKNSDIQAACRDIIKDLTESQLRSFGNMVLKIINSKPKGGKQQAKRQQAKRQRTKRTKRTKRTNTTTNTRRKNKTH